MKDAPQWLHWIVALIPALLGLLFLVAGFHNAITGESLRMQGFRFPGGHLSGLIYGALALLLMAFARRIAFPSAKARKEGPFHPALVWFGEACIAFLTVTGGLGVIWPDWQGEISFTLFWLFLFIFAIWTGLRYWLDKSSDPVEE